MAGINLMDRHMAIAASPHIENQNGSITFTKKALAMPVKKMLVDIESVQSGSGDPSPDNVRPISGWTGAKVTRTGKNLINFNELNFGGTNPRVINIYFDTIIGGTYTFSGIISGNATIRIEILNNSKTIKTVQLDNDNKTFTIDEPFNRFYCYIGNADYADNKTASITNFQLELGSSATNYEPYTGTTYPISWETEAGTVYGGTLDVTTGLLTVDRALVDMGTLNWRKNGQTVQFYSDTIANAVSDYSGKNVICSSYTGGNAYGASRNYLVCINEPSPKVFVTDDRYSDAATFKSAMSGVQLVYELATPQTYQLTPTEVKLLLGENNVWADTGNITMKFWSH